MALNSGRVFLSVLYFNNYFNNRAEKSGYLYTSAAAVAIGLLIGDSMPPTLTTGIGLV